MKNKKIATIALLAALAMIFGYIESLIPLPIPVYGAKVGISNTVILVSLYLLGSPYAFGIMLVKTLCQSLMFSGFSSFLYSFLGGLLSTIGMSIVKRTGKFGIVGVSTVGGVLHNIGQLLAAGIMISTINTMHYLPLLALCGVASGIVVGSVTGLVLKHLETFKNYL